MVLIEIALVIFAILLFLITDSRVINLVTEDILKEYNIKYEKISGNLFTGIKVDRLKYENRVLLNRATIHWNPFRLRDKEIHITQLELNGLRPNAIIDIISNLKSSKETSTPKLDFDITVDKINLTSRPLTYAGVTFKNFHLGTNRLKIDRNLNLKSELFNISMDSELTDVKIRGKVDNKIVLLDDVRLLQIDPKVITSFIRNIKKLNTNSSSKNSTKKSKTQSLIKDIKIKKLFATMKTTTYGPITIDNTRALIENIDIDPNNNFNYNAKEVTVSSDTSFASSIQKGFIKDSELFTTGDVITNEYLFTKYSLPLNRDELYSLPVSLKLNHKGIWLDIEHSVKDLLVLNSDFNVNLDYAKHRMDYEYRDNFITITSEANGSTSYTDGVNIKNIVNIDFRGEHTETTYQGDVSATAITNIPQFLTDTLLQHPTASYSGGVDELLVNVDSDQIYGSFLSQGYRDADIKLETKSDVPLSNLISSLPQELQMAQGSIQTQSNIDFHNVEQSHFHIDLNSDITNLSADMTLLKPYIINYSASVPNYSLLYNINPKINFANLQGLNGRVVLGENIHHIEVNNQEVQLNFDYDIDNSMLSKGNLFINGESISFDGSLKGEINARLNIQDINNLSNTLMRYYKIELPTINGDADITLKRVADNSMSIVINSPYLSYENMSGDINANINIDTYQNIDFTLNSSNLSYKDFSGDIHANGKIDSNKNMKISLNSSQISNENFRGDIHAEVDIDETNTTYITLNSNKISLLKDGEVTQKLHKLSTSFSIRGEDITVDNYSFRLRNNPYIRHIFSNKSSYLSYRDDTIYSKELWVNDQIDVTGYYNIPTQKGKIKLLSDYFPYKYKDFDLVTSFKLALKLNREKIFVSGNLKLLGNEINYELTDSALSEDSDIIIKQEIKEKKESILNNIKAYVTIENDTPIKYRTKDVNIDLLNEITIVKEYNQNIRLLGNTKIAKGYYMQEDKKFFLDESHIFFYGDPKESILEIRANYIKDKYDINIFISGSSTDPIINFSSNPYLSQREILSLILFDTATSDSGAGTAVYAMLGGTFAKELMKNLGVPVDHLLLGEGIDEKLSLEVGKKISDNVTFIIQHKNGKDGVKVKIDHNLNFETDIIIQPPNASSIEFLYKGD